MAKKKAQLIVALDVNLLADVRRLVESLTGVVDIFKVGSQLFTSCGPAAVRFIQAHGKKVFLDLKYHDIPNTVANAVTSAVGLSEAVERSAQITPKPKKGDIYLFMYTVHTSGGGEMMKAAVTAGAQQAEKIGVSKPLCVGVTVLTSEEKKDNILSRVLERALMAKESGLDGVVASPHEAELLRKEFGKDFIIVTPGIRPKGTESGDQKRIATPQEAIKMGSDFLVVGRPIIESRNPRGAAKKILEQIENA